HHSLQPSRHPPHYLLVYLYMPARPSPPLLPYTTLFRSSRRRRLSIESTITPAHSESRRTGRNCAKPRNPSMSAIPAGSSAFAVGDRKSTRLNSSHEWISYPVFCLRIKTRPDVGISRS